jgi:predicted flap endonuclease-1-like 5' DNA nuclease
MSLFSSILPCLIAAFALGALLGWALKSLFGDRRLTDLEEYWAARLRGRENEWELNSSKLRTQLNSLQADYNASTATIRTHEAALADWDGKYGALEASLAARTAELEQANADWQGKYNLLAADLSAKQADHDKANADWLSKLGVLEASLAAKALDFDKSDADWKARYAALEAEKIALGKRVAELEGASAQAKDWEMKFLQVSGDKDNEIKELQRQVSELEPLRAQTKDWELKYAAMLQERESESAKLRSRISELEPLSLQLNDWQTKYQATVAEKDATISSLQSQLSAAAAGAVVAAGSSAASSAPRGDLLEIEGIGDHYLSKLNAVNLYWQAELLEQGATKKGRSEIAEKSDINEKLILRWVNHIDLIRINGIGPQFAELLEAAGVDSVPELAQRNAENLHAKLAEVNAARNLVGRDATLNEVTDWIQQAKTLPRVVTH